MTDIARALIDKQEEVETRLAQLSSAPDERGGISFGKRVGDGTSMAVDRLERVAVHEQLLALLADVRRARVKLSEGSYGSCDRCGAAIAPERLEVLPWAVLCVGCAARR